MLDILTTRFFTPTLTSMMIYSAVQHTGQRPPSQSIASG